MLGSKRHPALEAGVIAAALLLAAFVGRELWRRRSAPSAAPPIAVAEPSADAALQPGPTPMPEPKAEISVSGGVPFRAGRIVRVKRRADAPPPPR
jgi:hypothetical protein